MKIFILAVVVLFSTTTASYSQIVDANGKRNIIEVYLPISHFFDGTPTNWYVLVPMTESIVHQGPNGPYITFQENYKFPHTLGFQFSHRLDKIWGYKISLLGYSIGYPYGRDKKPGDATARGYGLLSAGLSHKLIGNNSKRIEALGELNFRAGFEDHHVYYPSWFESRVETQELLDFGVTLGLQGHTRLFWNLVLTGGVKYTRYLYRYSDGKPPEFSGDKGTSKNTLTLKLGLGYQF